MSVLPLVSCRVPLRARITPLTILFASVCLARSLRFVTSWSASKQRGEGGAWLAPQAQDVLHSVGTCSSKPHPTTRELVSLAERRVADNQFQFTGTNLRESLHQDKVHIPMWQSWSLRNLIGMKYNTDFNFFPEDLKRYAKEYMKLNPGSYASVDANSEYEFETFFMSFKVTCVTRLSLPLPTN